jgi:hypothetical protein
MGTRMNILNVVSCMRRMSMDAFSEALGILSPDEEIDKGKKLQALHDMEALGHVHCDYSGRRVTVLSSAICLMPGNVKGQVRAFFTGYRPSDERLLQCLEQWCSLAGVKLSRKPVGGGTYLPERILLEGELGNIEKLVSEIPALIGDNNHPSPEILLGVEGEPLAWLLLHRAPSLAVILDSLEKEGYQDWDDLLEEWKILDPVGCSRHYRLWKDLRSAYHATMALIKNPRERTANRLLLARKASNSKWRIFHKGFPGESSIDPRWARWAVAQSIDGGPRPEMEPYERKFMVPTRFPLPLGLHRACVLCSGILPLEREGIITYGEVPSVISHVVMEKLLLRDIPKYTN